MQALEFDTISKDGFIYIPKEYKAELGNRQDIRLVVMYDQPIIKKENSVNLETKKEIQELEQLFLNSNNQIVVTKDNVINTDEMIDDIS